MDSGKPLKYPDIVYNRNSSIHFLTIEAGSRNPNSPMALQHAQSISIGDFSDEI